MNKPVSYRCIFMHRTAVLLSNGEMTTCAVPFAETVGTLENHSLPDLWLGPDMQKLRADLGTEREWGQCRHCWFREINYREQREQRDAGQEFDYGEVADYTVDAWDFREYDAE